MLFIKPMMLRKHHDDNHKDERKTEEIELKNLRIDNIYNEMVEEHDDVRFPY